MAPQTLDQVGYIRATPTAMSRRSGEVSASRSLQWIPDQAKRLAATGAVRGEAWSLAEVCEHLTLAIESTVRGHGDEGPPRRWKTLSRFEKAKRSCIRLFMLVTGWFPRGVPAPVCVSPSGAVLLEDAIGRLEAAVAAFDRKRSSPCSTWGHHSLLGKMTGRAWRRFHSIHAAHHFSCMKAESGLMEDEPIHD